MKDLILSQNAKAAAEEFAARKYGIKELKEPNTMAQLSSMTVGAKAAPAIEPSLPVEPKGERNTVTNWHALFEAGLTPTFIRCDGWGPYNSGCHSAMQLLPIQMKAHLMSDHGGGFFISFKENYRDNPDNNIVRTGQPWDGWMKFEELGVELKDFRCDICNEQVHLNVRNILRHCKAHTGKSSRLKPGGDFWLTISFDSPLEREDNE